MTMVGILERVLAALEASQDRIAQMVAGQFDTHVFPQASRIEALEREAAALESRLTELETRIASHQETVGDMSGLDALGEKLDAMTLLPAPSQSFPATAPAPEVDRPYEPESQAA